MVQVSTVVLYVQRTPTTYNVAHTKALSATYIITLERIAVTIVGSDLNLTTTCTPRLQSECRAS